jgi:hypothetical protein
MNGNDPTGSDAAGASSEPQAGGSQYEVGPTPPTPPPPTPPPPPLLPPPAPGEPYGVSAVDSGRPSWMRRVLSRKRNAWIAAGVLACAVAGTSIGVAAAGSSATTTVASSSSSSAAAGAGGPLGGSGSSSSGSNARSGPAAGGSAGTVSNVTSSGFTLTTTTGEQVTVDEASSTTYQNGTSATTASAVTAGESVLVLGTTNGTTITAAQVTVEPAGSAYTTVSASVIPFQQGSTSASQQIGTIPTDYTEGDGTIQTGTTAYQAAQAALAAYPGGIVDRVVLLSDGQYEVHYIGVNWPHHIFVNQSFQVVGAN